MPGEIQAELARYLESAFDLSALGRSTALPLPDEPFVAVWERWSEEARRRGAFAVLREHLPQLRFPIRDGMSRSEDYRAATLRGVPPDDLAGDAGEGACHAGAAKHVEQGVRRLVIAGHAAEPRLHAQRREIERHIAGPSRSIRSPNWV